MRHKSRYGDVPTLAALKADHPNYKFIRADETFDYLIDEIRRAHKLAKLQDVLQTSVEMHDDKDPDAILKLMAKTLSDVTAEMPSSRDTDLTQTGEERLERYLELRDLPDGLRGIPCGISVIDRATQGFQPEQLITFVGPPKAGKSTLALLGAMAAHDFGRKPLMVGFEMSNTEQEERYDAIRAHVSHSRLRGGSLKKTEWERLEKTIHSVDNMQPFWLSSDTRSVTTLTGLAGKIETIKPDILIVDGVYMMEDELGEPKGSPQALTNLTRGLKRMAQNFQIPVIATTQVLEWKMSRKQGITTNSIGYSSSFAQDSDVILGVEHTDDPTVNKIKVVIARNCPPIETYVQWDWDTGSFTELETDQIGDADDAATW